MHHDHQARSWLAGSTFFRARVVVVTAMMTLLIAGCGGSGGGGGGGTAGGTVPSQTWTIFVYGHGDHTLSNSLAADMVEMCQANLGSHMNVVVYADWNASATAQVTLSPSVVAGAPFPVGVEWYKIRGGGRQPTRTSVQVEMDLDQPTVLRAAVAKAFTDYPAQRYAVVMWDHGGSWTVGFGGDTQNGTQQGGGMLAPVVAQAVSQGMADAGVTQKLEFLAFDTCLMMGSEEAHEFKDVAKTYLACAEVDFGNGWDYAATLNLINTGSTASAQALAAAETGLWNAHHTGANSTGNEEDRTRAHAAIDLTRWTSYRNAYVAMWNTMAASGTLNWEEVARAGYTATPGYWTPITEGADQPQLRDAGQFLAHLSLITSDSAVRTKAESAYIAYNALFLGSSLGSMRTSTGQTGMHTELALAADYKGAGATRLTEYQATTWSASSGSGALLQSLVNHSDGIGPLPVTAVTASASTVAIQLEVTDTDVAESQIFLFQDMGGGNLRAFGEIAESPTSAGSVYTYSWNRASVTMADGSSSSYGFVARWISAGASTVYAMPGMLFDGTNTVSASVLFSESDAQADLVVITDDNGRNTVDSLHPGWTFRPDLLNYASGSDTWSMVPQTLLTVPASGKLNVQTYTVPAGSYIMGTSATDVWGNSDTQVDAIVLPASG